MEYLNEVAKTTNYELTTLDSRIGSLESQVNSLENEMAKLELHIKNRKLELKELQKVRKLVTPEMEASIKALKSVGLI